MALFDPARHEPLSDTGWDEPLARAAVEAIAAEAQAAFDGLDGLWPIHPLDVSDERPPVLTPLYYGAAGVIWALDHLGRRGFGPQTGYLEAAATLARRTRDDALRMTGEERPAYQLGEAGCLLLHYRLDPSAEVADRLAAAILACRDRVAAGFAWGAGGAMLPALFMHQATGEARWVELYARLAEDLWEGLTFDPAIGAATWRHDLYGYADRQLGALHGFAGLVFVLLKGGDRFPHREALIAAARQTLAATALREGGFANWPLVAGPTERPGAGVLRLQHCVGAPGMITALSALPADPETDALLLAGGELTWAAGPIAKLPGLCHGVPAAGYAFLKLHARTGEPHWLDRARAFAMHAIGQAERAKAQYGQRKWSLWTGDLGLAVFLADCVQGGDDFPTLDVF